MKKQKKSERGATMVELMVSLGIISMLTALMVQAFVAGHQTTQISSLKTRLSAEARMTMDKVLRELRNASSTVVTIPQQNIIQFQIPSNISNTGQITWSNPIRYELGGINGRQLMRRDVNTNATTVMANDIQVINFVGNQNPNPRVVTINLIAQAQTQRGHLISVNQTASVTFRN